MNATTFTNGAPGGPAYQIGAFVVPLLAALAATAAYVKLASTHRI